MIAIFPRGKLLFIRAIGKSKDIIIHVRVSSQQIKLRLWIRDQLKSIWEQVTTYRNPLMRVLGVIILISSCTYFGNKYVHAHMDQIYNVYIYGKSIGVIDSPQEIDNWQQASLNRLSQQYPNVQWKFDDNAIQLEKKQQFRAVITNDAILQALNSSMKAIPYGVEVAINGQKKFSVKDEATANRILATIKEQYALMAEQSDQVNLLSNNGKTQLQDFQISVGVPKLKSVKIVEVVEMKFNQVQPEEVLNEEDALHLLTIAVAQPALTVETEETVTDTIALQYETIYEEDRDMKEGQTKTVRSGIKGQKKITYLLIKKNGILINERIIEEHIIAEPIPAIVKRGSKIIPGEGSGKFIWPVVSARLTSGFGYRWGREHKGIDLISTKTTILASDHGIVSFTGTKEDYGKVVIIDHQNGYETLYAHLGKISVKTGSIVVKGDQVGKMGSTGKSTGVHLHFEIIQEGKETNPLGYLRK